MKYGTSGFRDHHTKILDIAEKIGMAMTLLAYYKKQSFGIMITASHNHYDDNGVKIMNYMGNMVNDDIEVYLENFVNGIINENEHIDKYTIDNTEQYFEKDTKLTIGYDSRKSSPIICDKIVEGIHKISPYFPVVTMKYITTPQLHFVFANVKTDYISYLKFLTTRIQFPCILDCANGIGSRVMKYLNHRPFYLINTDWKTHELLNQNCSSDYVCTYKKNPITPDFLTDLPYLRASLDGDADRIVFYYEDKPKFNILNGDYIAALIFTYMSRILKPGLIIDIGFVYTGYTNQACIEYVRSLKFPANVRIHYCCTATGVKNLHKEAMKYDVAVYFEQNGHGNVVFNKSIQEFETLEYYFHPNIGDGIMDFLAVLYILQELQMDGKQWGELYTPYKTILAKYDVQDKDMFESTANELKLLQPQHLQSYIDEICESEGCRIFIRASGTENCIRIFIESEIEQLNEEIFGKLTRYIDNRINNTLVMIKKRIFSVRFLDEEDINDNYYELLGQLTQVDKSQMDTLKTKEFIKKLNKHHRIFVIEDTLNQKVIASGTVFVEEKLIRNYGKVGHIEDIVVSSKYRGYGLGKKMIELLTEYAKMQGCYKCILDCSDENVGFYEKCDYVRKGAQMGLYYDV